MLKGVSTEELKKTIGRALARKRSEKQSCCTSRLGRVKSQHVRRAASFICENYLEDIGLSEIADVVGLSPKYISRLFAREIGMGPVRFLTSLRMKKAREMLQTTRETVNSIAGQLGYSYPEHFRRAFRQMEGCTPTSCRK